MPIEFKFAITFGVILVISVFGALGKPMEERNMQDREYRLWNWAAMVGLYGVFLALLVGVWRLA